MTTQQRSVPFAASCFILLIFGPMCFAATAEASQTQLSLVPYPQEIEIDKGEFRPAANIVFSYDQRQMAIAPIVETCIQDLKVLGFTATAERATKQDGVVALSLKEDAVLGVEGYRLKIDTAVSITAAAEGGLFWGTRTLLQLLGQGPGKAVPKISMTDYPDFAYRGLLIDNARKFHSLEFHIATVKQLAALKMNRYQIHFSDTQSYTLPS